MTSQEQALLQGFLQQLTEARAGQKDPEADKLIQEACARQPDAAYLLVQRALQLDQAFQAAQAQALELQTRLDRTRTSAAAASSGFLNDANAWGSQPRESVAQSTAAQPAGAGSAPVSVAAATGMGGGAASSPPMRPTPTPWGGTSLLGTVASTAAGVVAGSFLFQGIQGLMRRDEPGAGAQPTPSAANTPPEQVAAADDTALDAPADDYAAESDDLGGEFA